MKKSSLHTRFKLLTMISVLMWGCTPQSVSQSENRIKEVLASTGVDPEEINEYIPPAEGEPDIVGVVCASDEVWSGEECVKRNPGCLAYREISQMNETFVVPARTSAEICYYIKVFDAVPNGPSQTTRPVRSDVKSRNHSNASNKYSMAHPLVMGQRTVQIRMLGARSVMLSADRYATQNIKVDNFVLVEIMRENQQKIAWGAGSEDVRYIDENGLYSVKLNDAPLAYEVFAPAGTSEFTPVEFTNFVPLQEAISISISALDCRGSEESTDGYLIFR